MHQDLQQADTQRYYAILRTGKWVSPAEYARIAGINYSMAELYRRLATNTFCGRVKEIQTLFGTKYAIDISNFK
jgi:oligoendopeptidase F